MTLDEAVQAIDIGIYWGFKKDDINIREESWQKIKTALDENHFKKEFLLMYLRNLRETLENPNTTKALALMKVSNDIKILEKNS